jgi:3,4-dihydroxy 2-butanone 4-phosphate synthase / GTP cyclohydrolase II
MDLPRQSILQRSLAAMAQQGCCAMLYLRSASPGSEIDSALQLPQIARHPEKPDRDCQHDDQQQTPGLRCVRSQVLAEPGKHRARLLLNTPTHIRALRGFNVELVEQTTIADPASRD